MNPLPVYLSVPGRYTTKAQRFRLISIGPYRGSCINNPPIGFDFVWRFQMESIALYCAMAHFLLLLHTIVVMTKF